MKVLCVSAGSSHSAVVLENGRIFSWGLNVFGELGIGPTDQRVALAAVEVRLPEDTLMTSVACGGGFTLALDSSGSLWSWGRG